MITLPDLIVIICRVLDEATASWTRTFRLTLVLSALAIGPVALIILLAVIR